MNCSELMFFESYLPSDSLKNTVNLGATGQSTQNATHGAIFLRIADFVRAHKNKKIWSLNLITSVK